MLAFTSVYFFESGLFNGLQAIQIKSPVSPFRFAGREAIGRQWAIARLQKLQAGFM
jgi:hypothetical protein